MQVLYLKLSKYLCCKFSGFLGLHVSQFQDTQVDVQVDVQQDLCPNAYKSGINEVCKCCVCINFHDTI